MAKATKTAAASTNGKAEYLRAPQVRILTALAKAKKPLTRKEIAEKAPCDLGFLTECVGSSDDAVRAKNDEAKFRSLRTWGYVKVSHDSDADGHVTVTHTITASGKAALAKAEKAAKE